MIKNPMLVECGADLTLRLADERKALTEAYAVKSGKVSLLYEGTLPHGILDRKIETIQLNEIIYPYYIFARATGNDLYSRIVKQTIAELRDLGLVSKDSPLLQEGFWDSVQSGIGSFAGGVDNFLKKIKLKKEPEGWEQAQRIFTKIAEKEGNQVVQDLIKAIEAETSSQESGLGSKPNDQKFPVNKTRNVFFSGVNTIATTYDSIVAATEKDPGEEGYMPVEVANEIIEQLRVVVQKYMADTEREKGGMYASFGGGDAASTAGKEVQTFEADHSEEEVLGEQDEEGAEGEGEEKKEGADTGEEIDPDEEYEKLMRGQDSPVFARMTSLKAPLVIAGTGAALGAMGWVANQPWFHDFVLEILEIPKTTEVAGKSKVVMQQIEEKITEVNPSVEDLGQIEAGGGGLAKQTTRLLGLDSGTDLMGKDASLGDLKNAALKAGGGDLDQGLKNIAELTRGRGKPEQAYEWMKKAISDPSTIGADGVDSEGSLWKLFAGGTARGGGVASHAMPGGGIFSVGVGNKLKQKILEKTISTITKSVPRKIAGAAIKTGTASAASTVAMMTGAAPILAGIGVAAIGSGLALAAIRQRAKKSSRMGTFNELLQQLQALKPKPVKEVRPEENEESVVTITLFDAQEGGAKAESWLKHMPLLQERTEVEISGLSGNEELETSGGTAKFTLGPVSPDVPPAVTTANQIPHVIQGINDFLPDLDLASPNVTVKVIDKRNKVEIPQAPPEEETPPVPFNPAQIAKGNNAVVVFDPDGARVWRILKKVTFKSYAADAKKSGDKDAPEFADRHARYDAILAKLRADGVFVNSDILEAELSKISSGNDGKQYRVSYTRTRGEKKRKSSTGGYTVAGAVKNIGDIRKNIKGAPGSRPPRNVGDMTIIYLVGSNVLSALRSAGLEEDAAKAAANKAIAAWASAGKRPKIADLGVENEKAAGVLKKASLAEAFGLSSRHRYAVVKVTPKFFKRVLREVRESIDANPTLDRWSELAGLG